MPAAAEEDEDEDDDDEDDDDEDDDEVCWPSSLASVMLTAAACIAYVFGILLGCSSFCTCCSALCNGPYVRFSHLLNTLLRWLQEVEGVPAAKAAAAAAAAEEDEEDSDEEDSDEEDDEDVKMEQAPTIAAGVKRKAEVVLPNMLEHWSRGVQLY